MGVQHWWSGRRQRRLAKRIVRSLSSYDPATEDVGESFPEPQSETERDLALFLERERLYASQDAIAKGSSVDAEYARLLKERLGRLPDDGRYVIREVTTLGELENGDIAWVSDDGQCVGHTSVEFFAGDSVNAGQRFRVRIFSYLWGHRLEALLTPTRETLDLDALRRRLDTSQSAPAVRFALESDNSPTADTVAPRRSPAPAAQDSVHETWMRELASGDLVYVRVPFDDGIDRRGRTSKRRPAVFIRWEADYGVVRPYYKKDGYLDRRSRGTRIGGPKKDGIVRNTAIDVYPKDILRKIGQLDNDDRAVLGLGSRIHEVKGAGVPGHPDLSRAPKPSEYMGALNRVIETAKSYAWPGYEPDALLVLFMRSCRKDPEINGLLVQHAVPYSALGDAYRQLCDQLGVTPSGKKFGNRLKDVLFDLNRNERFVFETRHDAGQLPWMVLVDTRVEHGTQGV